MTDTASDVIRALAGGAWDAISAPGRAAMGEPATYGDAFGTAGMASLGNVARTIGYGLAPVVDDLASRSVLLHSMPTRAEVGDVGWNGIDPRGYDPEGRPLVARHVAGRTDDRVGDRALSPENASAIVEGLTGSPFAAVPQRALPAGSFGAVSVDRLTGTVTNPRYLRTLPEGAAGRVMQHETGHVVDELAGRIPTVGLARDLDQIYSYGFDNRFRTTGLTRPGNVRYRGDEVPREYMAEAIRQYMSAPDAMRERFPAVAARIREYVNANPDLNPYIQFNMSGVPVPFPGGDDE